VSSDINNKTPIKFNWQKVVNRLTLLISIGIIANLLIVYFFSGEFKLELLFKFRVGYLFLAFLFGILPMMIHALEIKLWAYYFGLNLSLKRSLNISASTILGSALTPTFLGGGPVKWAMLTHYGLRSGQAAAITTFTGIQDAIFLLMIITVSVFLSDRVGVNIFERLFNNFGQKLPIILAVIAGAVIIGFVVIRLLGRSVKGRKILSKLRETYKDFKQAYKLIAKNGWLYLAAAVFTTTLRWMSRFMVIFWLAKGLSIDTDYVELILANWLVYTGMTAVPTPGAAGGAEAMFYLVYKPLIPKPYMPVVIFAWRLFTEYMRLITAAVLVSLFNAKVKTSAGDQP
jgi:uncharacterized protein (TIRG00374 family)